MLVSADYSMKASHLTTGFPHGPSSEKNAISRSIIPYQVLQFLGGITILQNFGGLQKSEIVLRRITRFGFSLSLCRRACSCSGGRSIRGMVVGSPSSLTEEPPLPWQCSTLPELSLPVVACSVCGHLSSKRSLPLHQSLALVL